MRPNVAFPMVALLLLMPFPVQPADRPSITPPSSAAPPVAARILVFSRAFEFRHESIEAGIAAVQALGAANDLTVDATENPSVFHDDSLAVYQAVVFLNTTGDVLDPVQQEAFERYVRGGGGFVGVHSAADTEYDWPWYGRLVGAYFAGHPEVQPGTVLVADRSHPSTEGLPARWERTDEWYNYDRNPRGTVHVLATLDESTYAGGTQGVDHPIAWCHDFEGGRSWYTGSGHTPETFSEPAFLDHLLGGLLYASGSVPADCGATLEANFEKIVLDAGAANPIQLDIAPDGRVFYVEREGRLQVYDPATGVTSTAATFDVFTEFEDGLIGLALDPAFATNGEVYLFYSPAGPEAVQHVSRFTYAGGTLDMGSEQVLLRIPTQRDECCHSGGALAFGPTGDLYISVGDNTNPFASSGYAPIDEQPGRAPWDAQRTAANTQDLRGKILRIHPEPDGSYTIPEGNLFADPAAGRPEIYVMGARNPYRIAVDAETGWLYWGDVGPDAGSASNARGPAGHDEWNQTRAAGNYGWPYCLADNQPYRDHDFLTGASSDFFDCEMPVNESPHSTGAVALPPARPAWIWYPYAPSEAFPQIPGGEGRTAVAGPVYHYDPELASDLKLPAYYDDTVFLYDWARSWIMEARLDDDGDLLALNPFLPGLSLLRPIDMKIGPDGALYLLEWGTGYGGDNDDARLARLQYRRSGHAPVAVLDADPTTGPVPLTVQFTGDDSYDSDPGDPITFAWSFRGDDTVDATAPNPSFTYTEPGTYTARLTVTDAEGNQGIATIPITAGNTPPVVTLTRPVDGGVFDWGAQIPVEASVEDNEDGTTPDGIACADLAVQPFIGHDSHSHPLDIYPLCEGVIMTPEGHGEEGDRLFYLVEARYTDRGGTGEAGSLTARVLHRLVPRRLEAEHFVVQEGIELENTSDVMGGSENVAYIGHGDFIGFDPVNLAGIDYLTLRVASNGLGGRIEVRADGTDGPLLGTAIVTPTGGWQNWTDVTIPVDDPGGAHPLYLVFLKEPGDNSLFNVNFLTFRGPGMTARPDGVEEGLRAVYYRGIGFDEEVASRVEPVINFNWGDGAPLDGLDGDGFSVVWTGMVQAPEAGEYVFYVRSDDGARLWLDEALVIDQGEARGYTEGVSAPVTLGEGPHPIRLEYVEVDSAAQIHLLWNSANGPILTVPPSALVPGEAGPPPLAGEDEDLLPRTVVLHPVYPNPMRGEGIVAFELPALADVTLEVYDLLGRRVRTLVHASMAAGTHRVGVDVEGLAGGTYLCRLRAGAHTRTASFVVVR